MNSSSDNDDTVRYTRSQLPRVADEELDRLAAAMDDPVDTSDIPEQDISKFMVYTHLPVDPWVLAWFQKRGAAYKEHMRDALRAYVESQSRRGA